MGVYLREKKLGNGQVSFYLDIYHNKNRWYEFLDIRINKARPTLQDREKKRQAQQFGQRQTLPTTINLTGIARCLQKFKSQIRPIYL